MSSQSGSKDMWTYTVTPVLETSVYAAADVMAIPIIVSDAFTALTRSILLQSVIVVDEDDISPQFDIVLSTVDTTWGSINGAAAPSDAVLDDVVGVVEVATGDYADFVTGKIASPQFNPIVMSAKTQVNHLYMTLIARAANNFTQTDGLKIKLGFLR